VSKQLACRVEDLDLGSALRVDLEQSDGTKHAFAIVRNEDGDVYAIDDTCTHDEVSLSEGEIDGCTIECWAHGSRFDLHTGAPSGPPAITPVNTYPTSVVDGRIFVDVDAPMSPTKENA